MKNNQIKTASLSLAFLLFLSMSASCASEKYKWSPPPGGVIRDKGAAISMARIIWFSMNPRVDKSSEEVWQAGMDAYLKDGVWHVVERAPDSNTIGGGLEIDIDSKNGAVLSAMLTQ